MPRLALEDVQPLLLATLVWPPGTARAGKSIPVYAYAVRHPRGLILFDTGVGTGSKEIVEWQPTVVSLEAALAAIGRKTSDVVGIACCHLHFDHCGQNPSFPDVPIYAQKAEYAATREKDYTIPEWVDFPGAKYKLLTGDAEPWPGVHILSTPGHTPGHQSMLVKTDAGDVLLTGQAVYDFAELEGRVPLESQDDAYARSVDRLRSLKPRRIYVSHDQRFADQPLAGSR